MRGDTMTCSCAGHKTKACDAAIYGSLVFSLIEHGVYPRKSAQHITMSVNSLSLILRKTRLHHFTASIKFGTDTGDGANLRNQSSTNDYADTFDTPSGWYGSSSSYSASNNWNASHHASSQNLYDSGQPKSNTSINHASCAVSMENAVKKILTVEKSPVLDSHRVHMQLQRGEPVKPPQSVRHKIIF